jgi:hypothetical protein
MAINKRDDEFCTLDLESGWEVPVGYSAGSAGLANRKVLAGSSPAGPDACRHCRF